MAYNIENVIKKIVEKNFPSMGDPISYVKPSHYSELNLVAADNPGTDIQAVGDGRKYFLVGFSNWEGDDIVAE
jgi:hypothetical protein